jgi:hypothetical protein
MLLMLPASEIMEIARRRKIALIETINPRGVT